MSAPDPVAEALRILRRGQRNLGRMIDIRKRLALDPGTAPAQMAELANAADALERHFQEPGQKTVERVRQVLKLGGSCGRSCLPLTIDCLCRLKARDAIRAMAGEETP